MTRVPRILPLILPAALLAFLPRARLVAEGDEERGDVLAVPVDLRERRTSALGREAGRRELELHVVGLGLGASDVAARRRIADLDLVDGVTPDVIVPAEKSARSEEPAQRSVIERGDRVRER